MIGLDLGGPPCDPEDYEKIIGAMASTRSTVHVGRCPMSSKGRPDRLTQQVVKPNAAAPVTSQP